MVHRLRYQYYFIEYFRKSKEGKRKNPTFYKNQGKRTKKDKKKQKRIIGYNFIHSLKKTDMVIRH